MYLPICNFQEIYQLSSSMFCQLSNLQDASAISRSGSCFEIYFCLLGPWVVLSVQNFMSTKTFQHGRNKFCTIIQRRAKEDVSIVQCIMSPWSQEFFIGDLCQIQHKCSQPNNNFSNKIVGVRMNYVYLQVWGPYY